MKIGVQFLKNGFSLINRINLFPGVSYVHISVHENNIRSYYSISF